MDDCIPFPTKFPQHSFSTVLRVWKGEQVPHREIANCAWNVLGFAAGKYFPADPEGMHALMAAHEPVELTDEVVEKAFADAMEAHAMRADADAAAVDWSLIIPVLVQVALAVLKKAFPNIFPPTA